jgi:hypothetical protein
MGKVAADEGILSLYKGLLPVIIGSAPEMAVQVSTSWVFCCGSRSHTKSIRVERLHSKPLDDSFHTAMCGFCFFTFPSPPPPPPPPPPPTSPPPPLPVI